MSIILITGNQGTGKTILSRNITRDAFDFFEIDRLNSSTVDAFLFKKSKIVIDAAIPCIRLTRFLELCRLRRIDVTVLSQFEISEFKHFKFDYSYNITPQ